MKNKAIKKLDDTDEIKIEHGIPMPKIFNKESRWLPTLRKMEVGDSFFLDTAKKANSVRSGCSRLAPMKFSVRSYEGSFRCWRIK